MDRAPIGVHLAFVGYSYTATCQTGAIDRSLDIMIQIDHSSLRDCESRYTPEKLSQQWQLTDNLPDELSALLEIPLTLEQDLQRRLHEAERRYCELEKEMERLKGEMQDWRAPTETGKRSTALLPLHTIIFIILSLSLCPASLALPAHCVDAPRDRERAPPACHYPLVIPLHRHLLLFHRVRLPQVTSESYLLVCAKGGELQAWQRTCYTELS
ncbi:hypothetical protein KUCAC02_003828 [Chaenocephalus aceratus]|uniref:Uncharacterized protein n=1 Tax=Chaenocephalus aceratus TaxID=36190 RepID=A0ACB9WLS4_CHAAC|nr:hypothetical protein KUCAC02_003828 [Chaenocephalus aceratus]